MGLFSGIEKASFNEGGCYVIPGNYLVRIERVKIGTTRQGIGFFVVEHTILESNNPERLPGTLCSWMALSDKDPFLGNVKHFVAVATGTEVEDIDESGVEIVVGSENPLQGEILRIDAVTILTKAKREFTKVFWRTAEPEDLIKYRKVA